MSELKTVGVREFRDHATTYLSESACTRRTQRCSGGHFQHVHALA
jgi:hypothetical protein